MFGLDLRPQLLVFWRGLLRLEGIDYERVHSSLVPQYRLLADQTLSAGEIITVVSFPRISVSSRPGDVVSISHVALSQAVSRGGLLEGTTYEPPAPAT